MTTRLGFNDLEYETGDALSPVSLDAPVNTFIAQPDVYVEPTTSGTIVPTTQQVAPALVAAPQTSVQSASTPAPGGSFAEALIAGGSIAPDAIKRAIAKTGTTSPDTVFLGIKAFYLFHDPTDGAAYRQAVAEGRDTVGLTIPFEPEPNAQIALWTLGLPGGSLGWAICATTPEAAALVRRHGYEACTGSQNYVVTIGVNQDSGMLTGNPDDISVSAGVDRDAVIATPTVQQAIAEQTERYQEYLETQKAPIQSAPKAPPAVGGGTASVTPQTTASVATNATARVDSGIGIGVELSLKTVLILGAAIYFFVIRRRG